MVLQNGGTILAVLQCGGNLLAVPGTRDYGGIFVAVCNLAVCNLFGGLQFGDLQFIWRFAIRRGEVVFVFLAGPPLAVPGTANFGGILPASTGTAQIPA